MYGRDYILLQLNFKSSFETHLSNSNDYKTLVFYYLPFVSGIIY